MNLFAYGTLMIPEIFSEVTARNYEPEIAELKDYARFRLEGESFPAIVKAKGRSTEGVIYRKIDPTAFRRLDAFEGELYARTPVLARTGAGVDLAVAYVLKDIYRHLLTDLPWSPEAFRENEKDRFLKNYEGFARKNRFYRSNGS